MAQGRSGICAAPAADLLLTRDSERGIDGKMYSAFLGEADVAGSIVVPPDKGNRTSIGRCDGIAWHCADEFAC